MSKKMKRQNMLLGHSYGYYIVFDFLFEKKYLIIPNEACNRVILNWGLLHIYIIAFRSVVLVSLTLLLHKVF